MRLKPVWLQEVSRKACCLYVTRAILYVSLIGLRSFWGSINRLSPWNNGSKASRNCTGNQNEHCPLSPSLPGAKMIAPYTFQYGAGGHSEDRTDDDVSSPSLFRGDLDLLDVFPGHPNLLNAFQNQQRVGSKALEPSVHLVGTGVSQVDRLAFRQTVDQIPGSPRRSTGVKGRRHEKDGETSSKYWIVQETHTVATSNRTLCMLQLGCHLTGCSDCSS